MAARLGGRAYPLTHGGSFKTLRDARARRDLIGGELAAGRNPADLLHAVTDAPVERTFAEWAEAYKVSRFDYADETARSLESHLKRLLPAFGELAPSRVSVADVQEWVGVQAAELKPSSLAAYMATLRLVLDFAGVDPNPGVTSG